jgi:hypothetical protein
VNTGESTDEVAIDRMQNASKSDSPERWVSAGKMTGTCHFCFGDIAAAVVRLPFDVCCGCLLQKLHFFVNVDLYLACQLPLQSVPVHHQGTSLLTQQDSYMASHMHATINLLLKPVPSWLYACAGDRYWQE